MRRTPAIHKIPLGVKELTLTPSLMMCQPLAGTVLRVYTVSGALVAQYPHKAGVQSYTYLLDEDVNTKLGVFKVDIVFNNLTMHTSYISIEAPRDEIVDVEFTLGGACEDVPTNPSIITLPNDDSNVFGSGTCGCS